jgi:H+/Cl- antiporter ClcA
MSRIIERFLFLLRWLALACLVGVIAGIGSAAFIGGLNWATTTRSNNLWLIWLLPVAGFVIGAGYHFLGKGLERGSNLVIDQIHESSNWITPRMSGLVYVGSVITHLFGGSAGREGGAIQIAVGLTDPISKRLRFSSQDRSMMLVTAIAGAFGAAFGVPFAGTIFALEVQRVGRVKYEALIPAFTAALVGDAVVRELDVQHTEYPVLSSFDWDLEIAWKLAVLGLAAGIVAYLFVRGTHLIQKIASRTIAWYPLRPAIGGVIVAAMVLLFGWRDYQGLSTPLALDAFAGDDARSWIPKLLLTAITIGFGFVGGEVIPLFVMGALLGSNLSDLLGADPTLFAMMGAVAVLGAAANVPLACVVLGIELFGGSNELMFAVVCIVAYAISGHQSVYSAQIVDVPKWRSVRGR